MKFDDMTFSAKNLGVAIMITMALSFLVAEFRVTQKVQAANEVASRDRDELNKTFTLEKIEWINGRVNKKFDQNRGFFKKELDELKIDQLNQWEVIQQER